MNCIHSDKDTPLSVENARRLYAKGKEAGADIQYTEINGGTHELGKNCSPTVDEICELAARLLIERLKE